MARILLLLALGFPSLLRATETDAERAYKYLEQICELGPRVSGTRQMLAQRKLLVKHFEELGATVETQAFTAKSPLDGRRVKLANLIVRTRPEVAKRVLIGCHYDTRPFADQDPNPFNRQIPRFLGANDGASGTALLMELGHHLEDLPQGIAVDLVFFDAEELVYNDQRGDPYFLGSQWFARKYVAQKNQPRYECAVVVDMVGDRDLQIYHERTSYAWPETRPVLNEIWGTAARLGVKEFKPQVRFEIRDDHLSLRNIGKIPTAEIIDFDYPAWHTLADTPRNCSGESLAKVGRVLLEWLKTKAEDSSQNN